MDYGGSPTASSVVTRSSTTFRLLLTLLIGVASLLLVPAAATISADDDRGGSDESLAFELTSPDLYTRFSGGSGESSSGGDGGLHLQQAGSSLVIDGNALTVASSEPNATTWWLVELAPRDGLFAIQAVLVTQGVGGVDDGRSGDLSEDSSGNGVGSLRVLVGNDTRLQPSLSGGAWAECAPPGGDRSLRSQLFLCCSSASGGGAPVVGRAVAVYASSADGRVRPLNLNEVTVLGAPRQCPPGLFGPLCERRCGRCAGGGAMGSAAACDCGAQGCYATAADATGRRLVINECWLASSTPLVGSSAAAGRLELISNRQRQLSQLRPPTDRCSGRERRRSRVDGGGFEEYVSIRHAAFDLSASALESMSAAVASKMVSSSAEAWLLVGNDSRSPPYEGSPRWAKCGTSRIKKSSRLMPSPAGDGGGGGEGFVGADRRRTSVVLSCDTPTVGRYAVVLLRRTTGAIADDDDRQQQQQQQLKDEQVDAVSYAVLPAEQLLGFAVYVATATDATTAATDEEGSAAASAVDLSFLGYYWMNERRYATYMMLAFPALFAIVMMAATFAIACIKRKKVVAENAYYSATAADDGGDDQHPLLRRTAGGGASRLKPEGGVEVE